jgi:uncharacterized repeat protein (TIGR03806 family)
MHRLLVALTLGLLTGCGAPPAVTVHAPDDYPDALSAWGVVVGKGEALVLGRDVLPYDLAVPLFSDYALKLRTVWMPPGTAAMYHDDAVFAFPVGTVLSKTFYYPLATEPAGALLATESEAMAFDGSQLQLGQVRLIETRLLVKQPTGWDALVYIWDHTQNDATLEVTGGIRPLTLVQAHGELQINYVVPTTNDCAGCHTIDHHDGPNAGGLQPIGPAARHLNRNTRYGAAGAVPQLARWAEVGYLTGLPQPLPAASFPVWDAQAEDQLTLRARAYLDINCGHCHQPGAAGDTSGLFLQWDEVAPRRLGVCKPPIAAGRGTGGHGYSIAPGNSRASILLFRMRNNEIGIRMPELGRSVAHDSAVRMIGRWIDEMPGHCGEPARVSRAERSPTPAPHGE